jgi:polysaccharide deacetylase 2 family uncharacterized protein YibQ
MSKQMKLLLSLLVLSVLSPFILAQPAPVRLAIIIDDLGNSLKKGLDAIALPGNITFAVMPHRKHSVTLATRAGRLGKEVILHAPMSTVNGRALGPGALHQGLNEQQFKDKLRYAINSIPYVHGVNNHMGSHLTTQKSHMEWVMQVLKQEALFFVDSRTSAKSLAHQTALKGGVHSAQRDIFLDNKTDIDHIHQQFKKALAIAQKYGSVIAIGHPHVSTLKYLKAVLPQLNDTHIKLHYVSDLLKAGIQSRPRSDASVHSFNSPSLDQLVRQLQAKHKESP